MDANDRALCSAIYVYLNRVSNKLTKDVELTGTSSRKPRGNAPASTPGGKSARSVPEARPIKLAADDILIADFESEDFGGWKAEGTAFSQGPTETKGRVAGLQGEALVDTFIGNGSDQPTGSLTSPTFTIERKYLNFLIGGGRHPEGTGVALIVDGKRVHSATGNSTKNSQNRKVLEWVSWDVSDLKGKPAQIEIFDRKSGGWGHIVVDQIFLSNSEAK